MREGGCARPPAEPKHLLALGQGSSADLVESGVGNLIDINPRSSVNQLFQDLGHFCVRPAVIGVCTFFVVPQTHAESFLSGRGNERDFILKPFLFSKHGDDLLFQLPGKLRGAVGLQLQGYAACISLAGRRTRTPPSPAAATRARDAAPAARNPRAATRRAGGCARVSGVRICRKRPPAHLTLARAQRTLGFFHAMSADAQRGPARRCRATTPRTARYLAIEP